MFVFLFFTFYWHVLLYLSHRFFLATSLAFCAIWLFHYVFIGVNWDTLDDRLRNRSLCLRIIKYEI